MSCHWVATESVLLPLGYSCPPDDARVDHHEEEIGQQGTMTVMTPSKSTMCRQEQSWR